MGTAFLIKHALLFPFSCCAVGDSWLQLYKKIYIPFTSHSRNRSCPCTCWRLPGSYCNLSLLLCCFFCMIFWVAGFDILYSLQDFEFDKNEALKSIPASFGKPVALIVSSLFHLITAGFCHLRRMYGNYGCFTGLAQLFSY